MSTTYTVPLIGDEPAQELLDYLHSLDDLTWEGDDSGLRIRNLNLTPGSTFEVKDDGKIGTVKINRGNQLGANYAQDQ